MKVLKVIVFIIITMPLIVIGVLAWLLNMFCYYAAEGFEWAENITDRMQRTSKFEGWISWARKVSKLD